MLLAMIASGCTGSGASGRMVPTELHVQKQHPHRISTDVRGVPQQYAMAICRFTDDKVKLPLDQAITQSKIFASVVEKGEADLHLHVEFTYGQLRVLGGMDAVVNLRSYWRLTHPNQPTPVWHSEVEATHTTAFVQQPIAPVRQLRAVEGAVRNTIETGLRRLSLADL
jgi:hypothetical protein